MTKATMKMKEKVIKILVCPAHYALGKTCANSFVYLIAEFCESCVAVNPNDPKIVKNKIVFSTGCESARCVADLRIKSSLENMPRY